MEYLLIQMLAVDLPVPGLTEPLPAELGKKNKNWENEFKINPK